MAQTRQRHQVAVIYTKPPWESVPVPDDLPYELHWATLPDFVSRRNAPFRAWSAYSVSRKALSLLSKTKRNVIHSHGGEGGRISQLRPASRFAFVSTPRYGRYPDCFKNDSLSAIERFHHAKFVMQRDAARTADLVVPPSQFAADLVREYLGVPRSQLRVVYNGIPSDFLAFEHDAGAIGNGPIVFFGRFDAAKGIDTLIDAYALAGRSMPPLLIVGHGNEQQRFVDLVAERRLGDRVRFMPWQSHNALGVLIAKASMVVVPSRYETLAGAAIIAMAIGAPVIATRVGGSPEIVLHEETGLLVDPDNPAMLAAGMQRLYSDVRFARTLADTGVQYARQKFNWDSAATSFESLYQEILAN